MRNFDKGDGRNMNRFSRNCATYQRFVILFFASFCLAGAAAFVPYGPVRLLAFIGLALFGFVVQGTIMQMRENGLDDLGDRLERKGRK